MYLLYRFSGGKRILSRLLILIALCGLLSCPTAAAEAAVGRLSSPHDPYESFNRHAFAVNQTLEKVFLKPAATVYQAILPWPVRQGVNHVFNNLAQIPTILNELLQARFYHAVSDVWRFLINSTIGVGGLVDVASRIGLPPHQQDFGLTLAKWGYRSSAYLVVPLLGPRTVRDALAWPIEYEMSIYPKILKTQTRYGLLTLDFIDNRAQLLAFDATLKQISFDPYVFQRNAYLQHRSFLIH